MYDHVCERCGKGFCTRVKHQRFCGAVCSGLGGHPGNVTKSCVVCGREFSISRQYDRDTCSKPCAKWHRRRPDEKPTSHCMYCGGPVNRQLGALYCSPKCNTLSNVAARRVRKLRLPAELIDHLNVFERDNWTCHLCGDPVSPAVKRTDPFGASLDHIIPISIPGCPGHVWENVALAHRWCNGSKSNYVTANDWALHRKLLHLRNGEGGDALWSLEEKSHPKMPRIPRG